MSDRQIGRSCGLIKVGAPTETELRHRKLRMRCPQRPRAASEEGHCPVGGKHPAANC